MLDSVRPRPGLFPFVLVLGLIALPAVCRAADGDRVQFNRDIRPLLTENCLFCHGPDKNHREARLRLDVRDDAIELGAIVAGKPDDSELIARIFSEDEAEVMPPPKSNKHLTPQQKQLLKRWIAEGAEYQSHWSYIAPSRPSLTGDTNGIDQLVQRRLSALHLKPSPEADRRTLVRRLFQDLIGLPPTPAEVEAFVNDSAADAWPRLVDRLLASPHYGERMAQDWLDVVRFADTIGYHSDTPRNVYPYRDYVIRSFNTNKPFDQFTVEQLAGDLLPNSTLEQQVASCFNMLLLTTEEGGAQARDYEARMLGDRVRAVGTVWLGQTLGCCQCHDHKFDPAKTRDFYAMGAFFADLQEPIIGRRPPGIIVPDAAQTAELARLDAAAAEVEAKLNAPSPELATAQAAWEQDVARELANASQWTALHPEQVASEQGVQFKIEPGEIVFADRNPRSGADTYRITVKTKLKQITGFQLDALPQPTLPQQGPGRAESGSFVLTEFSVADAAGQAVRLQNATATNAESTKPAAAAIDGNADQNNGWSAPGLPGASSAIRFELENPLGSGDELTLVFSVQQKQGANHVLGRFRISATTAPRPLLPVSAVLPPTEIVELITRDAAQRDDAQRAKLAAWYRAMAPGLAELRIGLFDARRARTDYENTLPRCMVSVSTPAPRTVRILPRGNWLDDSGELMQPALPGYLVNTVALADSGAAAGAPIASAGAPASAPAGAASPRLTRLDLARWIVSRENPLTARVFVNRLWKQFFGSGLSKTVDDLGAQGEWPTNPELLDWLACEFMDSGWDVKQIVRTIVLSSTYRQVSTVTPELLEKDPFNRELARQSRYRLDAELVRDNALRISGLLVEKVGGPSVKPYQPDGYWENLNFPVRQYEASTGEDLYRRGLYTWWQRSFLHPSLLAFDAPTREECAAERNRSNIPQQALVLLNDPIYVEAARAFATRILKEGGADTDSRLTWAWQRALSRPPRDDERRAVAALLERQRAAYTKDTAAAEALLKVGQLPRPEGTNPVELAAWTSAARVLLNLHEVITRN